MILGSQSVFNCFEGSSALPPLEPQPLLRGVRLREHAVEINYGCLSSRPCTKKRMFSETRVLSHC